MGTFSQESDKPKGLVLYSVTQVAEMQDSGLTLERYFRGLSSGKALYEGGVCVTPTVMEALDALEAIARNLGAPILSPKAKALPLREQFPSGGVIPNVSVPPVSLTIPIAE